MKLFFVIIVFMFIYQPQDTAGAVTIDTAYGEIGDYSSINIYISGIDSDSVNLSIQFTIDNPTVFYPEIASITNSKNSADIALSKIDKFNYSFELTDFNLYGANKLIISITGLLLAGNDSICRVNFKNCYINGSLLEISEGVVISDNGVIPLPYLRYSKLYQNFPNPVVSGSKTVFKYYVDKETYADFILCNNLGATLNTWKYDTVEIGEHEFEIITGNEMSAGSYMMFLKTITGMSYIRFIVIK